MYQRIVHIVCVILCFGNVSYSQKSSYTSYSGSFNTYIIAMDLKGASAKPRYNLYYGLGGNYGTAIKGAVNFRVGADLFYFKPKNVRGYYEFCRNANEQGSCIPIVTTFQFQIPLELEFFENSEYGRYRTFFSTGVMPVISFIEKGEMIEFDDQLREEGRYEIKNNGLKLQKLYLLASVTIEFLLFGNFRFYVEPSVRVSTSFKRIDYTNPIHYFIVKSGIRARIEK